MNNTNWFAFNLLISLNNLIIQIQYLFLLQVYYESRHNWSIFQIVFSIKRWFYSLMSFLIKGDFRTNWWLMNGLPKRFSISYLSQRLWLHFYPKATNRQMNGTKEHFRAKTFIKSLFQIFSHLKWTFVLLKVLYF